MGKTWEDDLWTTTIDFSLLCLFGFLFPSSSAAVTDEPRVEESARIPLPRIDGKTYVRSRFQHKELSPHFDFSSVVTLTYMFDFLRYLFFLFALYIIFGLCHFWTNDSAASFFSWFKSFVVTYVRVMYIRISELCTFPLFPSVFRNCFLGGRGRPTPQRHTRRDFP